MTGDTLLLAIVYPHIVILSMEPPIKLSPTVSLIDDEVIFAQPLIPGKVLVGQLMYTRRMASLP